ncbi:MAG: DUF4430 domain-containing protein [Candidatus Kerfeldbacteria bacterium]
MFTRTTTIIIGLTLSAAVVLGGACPSVNDNGYEMQQAGANQSYESVVAGAEAGVVNEVAEQQDQKIKKDSNAVVKEAVEEECEQPEENAPTITTSAGPEQGAADPEEANLEAEPEEVEEVAQEQKEEKKQEEKAPEQQVYAATLQVVTPSGTATYTADINTGASVEQLMKNAKSKGFIYTASSFGGMGSYVKAINGLEEDLHAGMFWIYYVNGQKATVGISSKMLNKGDSVKWSYEKSL